MSNLMHHARFALRQAWRSLRQSPFFAVTVVLTLAIGIGLNDSIFTVVDCVLLRPLGYRDADRIVAIHTRTKGRSTSTNGVGGDDYNDLLRDVHGFAATAFYSSDPAGVRIGNDAAYLRVASVSPRFGDVMGVEPVAGRLFQSDAAEGIEALVSTGFAQEHFGTAASALGHTVQSGALTRVIVGVLPDGFRFPQDTAVWLETGPRPDVASRTAYNQHAVGKRRTDTSPAQLAAELDTFSHRLAASFPEDRRKQLEIVPLRDEIVGRVRPTLQLLMGAVAVVLLIVCTNLAHLQIVRSTRRMRAVTIRTALGASRASLAAEALAESVLLAADKLFAPSVLLINATLARKQFPGQDPVGKQIMCGYDFDSSWWTVVGVVGDIHANAPGRPVTPTMYVPLAQHLEKAPDLQLEVRTSTNPAAMAETLRLELKHAYPDVAVRSSTMTENVAETQRLERLRGMLFGSFAGVSLFLAAMGIYGVTAYSVSQRRFEFGLRLAVGATRAHLLSLVLREALGLALLGTAVGALCSLALTRLLDSVLGKLPAFDALAYALAALTVLFLATLAALVPAQRAARTEPMEVLRYE